MGRTIEKNISPQQLKALHAKFRNLGMDEEARRSCIYSLTGGRTDSLKDISFSEARHLFSFLDGDMEKKRKEAAKNLLRGIFALSFQISFLNKDYNNDTPEEFEMNKAKLNVFARNRSKARCNVTEMTLEELKSFKKQLEKIVYKENELK